MAAFHPSLVELIGLDDAMSTDCLWHVKESSKKVRNCGNPGSSNREERRQLVQDLQALISYNNTDTTSTSSRTRRENNPKVLSLLRKLSEISLCQKNHRARFSPVLHGEWT